MKTISLFSLSLVVSLFAASASLVAEEVAPLKILRVGDSITRYAASDPTLCQALEQAGISHEMVGSQASTLGNPSTRMEGYNGKTIQFFTTPQKEFGHPATLNKDATPIDLAIERFQPELILLMVGTNNLGNTDKNEIDVPRLRGLLDDLLNRIHQLAPSAHVIVSTATPAVNNYKNEPNMTFRNERTITYNEKVVKPAVAALAVAGRSVSLADAFAALDPTTDLSDGVHPNDAGKAKINATWFAAIQEWRKSE